MKKNRYLSVIIVIISTLILCALGIWQLFRLKEKNNFLFKINQSLSIAPKNLEEVNNDPIYSKIKLTGHFLSEQNIYLYGRVPNKEKREAYYLITPFITSDNNIILVARGWFFKDEQNNILSIKNCEYEEIIGIILQSEKKQALIPNNDFKNNIWFTLNIEDAEKFLNEKLENFYLIQINEYDIKSLHPINPDKLLNIRNDHLEYAFTWFGLALSLLIIFFIGRSKKAKINLLSSIN